VAIDKRAWCYVLLINLLHLFVPAIFCEQVQLELGLIQARMAQKSLLWVEVVRARRAEGQNGVGGVVWAKLSTPT